MGKRANNGTKWKIVGVSALAVAALGVGAASIARPVEAPLGGATYTAAPQVTQPVEDTAIVPATTDDIKALLGSGKEATISILGDSTGDAPGEWVDLWAKHLSATHTVKYFAWDGDKNAYPYEPETFGSGPVITIWNGSRAGATGKYALDRFPALQPQKPSVVIYNYGHNSTGPTVVDELSALNERVTYRWGATPYVVTLQNPAQGTRATQSAASVEALRAFVTSNKAAYVDVTTAFGAVPLKSLLADEVHPNSQGSQIWVDAVVQTLG